MSTTDILGVIAVFLFTPYIIGTVIAAAITGFLWATGRLR